MKKISAVVLDLGGVVFDLDWRRAMQGLQVTDLSQSADFPKWVDSWSVCDQFERGKMSENEFFTAFQRECHVSLPIPALIDAWNSLIVGPVFGIEKFLGSLPDTPIFALSNTNATHFNHLETQYKEVMSQFDIVFTSHQLGLRKPEKQIFEEAVRAIQFPHSQILFIDDTMRHVDAAREVGLCAEQCVSSVQKLGELLRQYGCKFEH